jgi:hypothetical protein
MSGIEIINGVVHRYSELPWVYDDGGRAASGRKGITGDCVARAVAIASGCPYDEVYRALAAGNARERGKRSTGRRTAREGIHTDRSWFRAYMKDLGFSWVPTMRVGTGCRVHLRQGELPEGRLVVAVSRHLVAVIGGVVHDLSDPTRGGSRCVYGYYLMG